MTGSITSAADRSSEIKERAGALPARFLLRKARPHLRSKKDWRSSEAVVIARLDPAIHSVPL
jgi:hypothetical protein